MTPGSPGGVRFGTPSRLRLQDPIADLVPKAKVQPPSRWEGRIKGEFGSAARADFNVIATLAFGAGLFEGEGRSPEFPYGAADGDRVFYVSGDRQGDQVRFELCFYRDDYFNSRPYHLEGALDAEERLIRGRWRFSCGSDCDCGGSGGWFELRRIG